MKRCLILIGILFYAQVSAKGVPEELNLVFPDRILTLNFEAQPELLMQAPQHFLVLGETRIPIDLQGSLVGENEFLKTETKFVTEISTDSLREFFKESSILRDENIKNTVEILLDTEDEILFEGQPRNGFDIEEERLVSLINEAFLSGKEYVRVPAKKVFSEVVVHPDLKERGIQEIIAIGESNFAGSSEARRQNIIAGAKKFNGAIVEKGRTFSFNKVLESVLEDDGFVRELVIKGNKTEKELGGGVCQVSTTAYRAAFSGGFPITSRRNHSYAVPYYKPYGLDAAIYIGALDLRFRNDTVGDILIQTFTEGDNLFFVFYGTDDGRQVSLEGPFISNYKTAPAAIVYETEDLPLGEMEEIGASHDGFRAEWVRRIENGGDLEVVTFTSDYRPWAARQRVGTKISKKF